MSVSKLLPSSGSNDFNVTVTGTDTSVTFDKEYASGAYTINISGADSSFDIYAYNASGALAGYTNTASFTASLPFNKMVVIGQTAGTLLSFSYKKTYTTSATSDEVTAGPVITSISPSSLPNINDSLVVTGKNFASDCTVTFTSANTAYSATAAKSVVRSSATSLIVTRPDNLAATYSPYTLTVSNPGVTNPTGSNSHILSNGITAGAGPVWSTGTVLHYVTGASTSFTLSATDADAGSTISYSIASGTLPTGLSFNTSTAVISGTPSTSQQTVTFRATDAGGNFADRAIKFNAVPVFTSAATAKFAPNVAFSFTVTTTDDTATARTFAITSGTLPSGFSLASNGVISGTSNGSAATVTVTATDGDGGTASQSLYLDVATIQTATITSSGTWTSPSSFINSIPATILVVGGGGGSSGGAGSGGSGGGGANSYTATLAPSTNYSITIGGGGASGSWYGRGGAGGTSTGFGYSQGGGGAGGPANGGTDNNGGNSGNGFSGGGGNGQLNSGDGCGGGGAGAGGNGGQHRGNIGGNPGAPYTWSAGNGSSYGGGSCGGDYDGGGGAPNQGTGGAGLSGYGGNNIQTAGTANTGGAAGSAGGNNSGGPFPTGGSGVVIVRYYA
jgi:hypothetical protein